MKNVTLKQALALPCTCGGKAALDRDEPWMIYCQSCGKESVSGCLRHCATNSWYALNKVQQVEGKE